MATIERSRTPSPGASGNPVWRKAPGSLLRHPSLFASLALGAFLVALSTVAYPLFLSASGSALVRSEIDNPTVTRYGAGVIYTVSNVRLAEQSPDGHGLLIDRRLQLFAQMLGASPAVGPVVEQAMGDEVAVTGLGGRIPSSGPPNGVLFFGTRALDHVAIVAGADGPGVWLPDYVAEPLKAGPGDRVELRSGRNVVTVTVDGVYRALYAQPSTGYWRTWSEQLYPCPDCAPPPQPILVDRSQLIAMTTELGTPRARFAISAPVRADPPLSLDEARELSVFAERFGDQIRSTSSLREVFPCCGRLFFGTGHTISTELLGGMSGVVRVVDQRIASVQGPVHVLFLAGLIIAFGVVAAAGVFSFTSRRVDAGVLAVRGWGPGRVGVKAVLESVLPCAIGAVVGFLVASGTIAWLGPDGSIEPSARTSAFVGSLVATLGVIALVGIVSALSFASHHEPRPGWPVRAARPVGGAVARGRLGRGEQAPHDRRRARHDDRAPGSGGVPVPVAPRARRRDPRGEVDGGPSRPTAARRPEPGFGVVPGDPAAGVVIQARDAVPGRHPRSRSRCSLHRKPWSARCARPSKRRPRYSWAATSSCTSDRTPRFLRTSGSRRRSRRGRGRPGDSRTPTCSSICWPSTPPRSKVRRIGTRPSPIGRSPISCGC